MGRLNTWQKAVLAVVNLPRLASERKFDLLLYVCFSGAVLYAVWRFLGCYGMVVKGFLR